jgi:hypothetical protein
MGEEEDDIRMPMHLQFPSLSAKKRPHILPQEWEANVEENDIGEFEMKRPNVETKGNIRVALSKKMEKSFDSKSSISGAPKGVEVRDMREHQMLSSEKSGPIKPSTHSPQLVELTAKRSPSSLESIIGAILSLGTEKEFLQGQLDSLVHWPTLIGLEITITTSH